MPPVDCTAEADFAACANCFAEEYPDGATLYNGLVECVICTACYTSCDGAGSGCPMPPAMKDMCDTADMADPMACGDTMAGCIACAFGGTCVPQLGECQNNAECVDFANAIGDCPN